MLAVPLITGALAALIPNRRLGSGINVLGSMGTLAAAAWLLWTPPVASALVFVDDLNIYLVLLTAFIGFTTTLYSTGYMAHEVSHGHLTGSDVRMFHSLFQLFMFTMLLGLTANNLGLMWVAIEAATLATAPLVNLYRSEAAIEAAVKYFILCGVGISMALFGIILVYLAAQPHLGSGMITLTWTDLYSKFAGLGGGVNQRILELAFVFLLIGYGTKTGLAPVHAWLPDAHTEGPTPVSAVLSGLLLNVSLYAILRYKMLLAANGDTLVPAALMIALGLVSLLVAGLMLYRRRDIKRFYAYSSVEHMGIATFAFGIGGPIANFAGLLHMAMHSLTKSALFFTVGHMSQIKGTRQIAAIKGLVVSNPALGWALVLGMVMIAGLPPSGIFVSEFLIVTSTVAHSPWLVVPLLLGLLIALGAFILRLQGLAFGAPTPAVEGKAPFATTALAPVYLHLGLVVVAGLWLPGQITAWFQAAAKLLG
ncbi:MAG: hydrogenase 4 subunit F [Azospirillum sp.]|nr:hydrogenase 4 subunit F [Azospirillum sp.]